ncbi:POU domain, class 5, transcription factor 3-like [Panicum virgatum]|uniref:POU domain, class 5, transcription factor 3-like n=1 Tax=Panicum virgatum TaxID=38727 RepID=UPI0019D4F290|nr:POU domain, class 5, transcription factor 3-like [Panicum virgatum]
MPPPPAPPSLQQPPAPPCLQRRRPLHTTREATPCAPPAGRRWPPGRTSLPAGATTVRPPFLTHPAEAARVAPALPARALCARHWAAAAAPGAPVRALVTARAVAGCSAAGSPALPPPTHLRTAAVQPARRLHIAVNAATENLRTPAAAPLQ